MLDDYTRAHVNRAIEDALHPRGMSIHSGKASIDAGTLQRLVVMIDRSAEARLEAQDREEFYIARTREAQQIAAAAQDRIERLLAEVERLRGALTAANAQAEHFEREWYLRGDEVEQLRAENMALRNQRDELRIVLDKRPAATEGMLEAYVNWSAGVYALDWLDAAIDAMRKEDTDAR